MIVKIRAWLLKLLIRFLCWLPGSRITVLTGQTSTVVPAAALVVTMDHETVDLVVNLGALGWPFDPMGGNWTSEDTGTNWYRVHRRRRIRQYYHADELWQ